MNTIRYTLLPDGSSDEVLLNHLSWVLRQHFSWGIQPAFAHMKRFQHHPKDLGEKIVFALENFPCDLLFIHRDAENMPYEHRHGEVQRALAKTNITTTPVVCVIPVRMQEAWLLFDEVAIRAAAGRPSGRIALSLPAPVRIEAIADPKEVLHTALKTASERKGRRLDQFRPLDAAQRVGELIDDFSPLLALSAFAKLNEDIRDIIRIHHWQ